MKQAWFLSFALLAANSAAQEPLPLEQLQQLDKMQQALDAIDQYSAGFSASMRRRQADCDKAIGYSPFCDCIMKDLPVAWSFADYVAITTRTREENGYQKMDAELRGAYDKVAPIRDKCIRLINKR
jgi:hypothetical protein